MTYNVVVYRILLTNMVSKDMLSVVVSTDLLQKHEHIIRFNEIHYYGYRNALISNLYANVYHEIAPQPCHQQ